MTLPLMAQDLRVLELIDRALQEELGALGDVTTRALVPPDAVARGAILARHACVVAGGPVAAAVFARVDPGLDVEALVADGEAAEAGAVILGVTGRAASILTAERTALNFMQRLTGIATLTRRFVDKVQPYGTTILDTRKTTPGLRVLEKYAVTCGGGANHRMGLYDRALIKDNHRALWRAGDASRLDLAVEACRRLHPGLAVEVEVESLAELECALRAAPEWVLLDNMAPELMAECVRRTAGRARLEASGGITLANVEEVARTGVDAISLGCLTHSAPAADLSLELD